MGSSEEVKEVEVKPTIITPTKIVALAVLCLLVALANQRGPLMWVRITPMYLFLLLMALPVFKKRLTSIDLAFFFIGLSIAAYFPYIHNWRLALAYSPKFLSPALWEKVSKVVPSFMVVPKELLDPVTTGGAVVPAAWAVPLTYYILLDIVVLLLGISVATFWAEQFVEIEKLPFPYIVPAIQMISIGTEYIDKKPRLLTFTGKARAFWIAFLLMGIPVGTLVHLTYFSSFRPMPWGDQWPLDLRPYLGKILPGAYLRYWPFFSFSFIGYAFLAPMDTLITIILFFVIFYILYTPIGIYTGFLPPTARATAAVPGWDWPTLFPYRLFQFWSIPVGLGLALIIFNWRYFTSRVKAIFGGSREIRPGEVPPSWTLGLFIISCILFIVLFAVAGAPIASIIVWLIIWLLIQAANIRFVATVFPFPHRYFHSMAWALWPVGGYTANPELTTRAFGTAFMMGQTDNFWSQGALYPWGMTANYKIAHDLKLSYRDAFKVMVIATIIGSIVCMAAFVWLSYYIGLVSPGFYRYTIVTKRQLWGPPRWRWYWDRKGPMPDWDWRVPWFIVGILITLAIVKLRIMFPWFFICPVGIFFAWHSWFFGSAIFGLIAKYLVIKIGGARWYEEYGVPGVAGYIVGYAVATTVGLWIQEVHTLLFGKTWTYF